ncbi:hypothetical protein TIFTF001_030123 [Ficus carica]|uniref:Peptidase S8/S53 domain-containing protein n=1 Tax=Ficus carica TaxID=3494 RepID=A0AA88DSQ4_FICCA|nr:hypothetical protein TIFTF001_030123 [Ficus carica]
MSIYGGTKPYHQDDFALATFGAIQHGVLVNVHEALLILDVISGTSVACPHVSRIAALLIKAYPRWLPAAIKSAITTTTYNLDNSGRRIKDLATGKESMPFVHGLGHLEPNRALYPGWVNDTSVTRYVGFLCYVGYNHQLIGLFFRQQVCPLICKQAYAMLGARVTPRSLHLPSFSMVFNKEVETEI